MGVRTQNHWLTEGPESRWVDKQLLLHLLQELSVRPGRMQSHLPTWLTSGEVVMGMQPSSGSLRPRAMVGGGVDRSPIPRAFIHSSMFAVIIPGLVVAI